jgi:glutamate-5-semialdehyde dehydrogenase
MADALEAGTADILAANALDVADARSAAAAGELAEAFVDRLALSDARIAKMAGALRELVAAQDPVGCEDEAWMRPNGLRVAKRRIPLGVVAIIYEARPNVTSDAAALCIKSGNAVVLKGGSRALRSNRAVVAALHAGLAASGMPPDVVQFVDSPERDAVRAVIEQEDYIDLVIPRGGEGLVRFVAQNARVPVIKHYKGVCHVFLDAAADVEKATAIAVNAKVHRPGVCNAMETLLVHADRVSDLLPAVGGALVANGVTLHLDARAMAAAQSQSWFDPATCREAREEDLYAEYLSLDVAVAVVDDFEAAVLHIQTYGSEHTESIVTEHYATAEAFLNRVNSSVVIVNASTRFADGGQLGLGAEIGISTTKLHAFGPMGLRELTTTKFVIRGNGQVRI